MNTINPFIQQKKTGETLRKLMKQKGYSVKDVQEACGFEYPQAVYKWLRGECLPSVDNLVVLSILLGVRIDDILVYDDEDVVIYKDKDHFLIKIIEIRLSKYEIINTIS